MWFAARTSLAALVMLVVGMVGNASADPVKSPNVSFATLVLGDVTYTVVSPNHAPVAQMLTANGGQRTVNSG